MQIKAALVLLLRSVAYVCATTLVLCAVTLAQVTIAQISDTHIGEKRAPHAADNLKLAVQMINDRHPDAVILSGDIGENPEAWEKARSILKHLKPPLYYAPGNHDVHSSDVDRYRSVFGKDYYTFEVKGITFLVINSQLLGNFDNFEARSPQPLPPQTQDESERMLSWLRDQNRGGHHGDHDRDQDGERRGDNDDRGRQNIIIG